VINVPARGIGKSPDGIARALICDRLPTTNSSAARRPSSVATNKRLLWFGFVHAVDKAAARSAPPSPVAGGVPRSDCLPHRDGRPRIGVHLRGATARCSIQSGYILKDLREESAARGPRAASEKTSATRPLPQPRDSTRRGNPEPISGRFSSNHLSLLSEKKTPPSRRSGGAPNACGRADDDDAQRRLGGWIFPEC